MVFWNKRRPERAGGRRQRSLVPTARLALESLETRQLMAYSAFGYSLPQLSVTGYTAPVAAPGGYLAVDVKVQNLGASSLVEPASLYPAALSSADVINTSVQIYGSATPNGRGGRILLGNLDIPLIRQNSNFETVVPVILPANSPALANLRQFYITLAVNSDRAVIETNYADNVYRIPRPITIDRNPAPDLQVTGFDIPATLQPGDVITPTIRIANLGVGDPGNQGPVTVALVASLDTNFGPGDVILSTFTIDSLPGINAVPTQTTIANAMNLYNTPNEFTITLPTVALPAVPGFYYLGIKIDPVSQINQTYAPTPALSGVVPVGPADQFLTPSIVQINNPTPPVFPNLPVTFLNPNGVGQSPLLTTLTPTVLIPAPVQTNSVHSASVKSAKSKHHR